MACPGTKVKPPPAEILEQPQELDLSCPPDGPAGFNVTPTQAEPTAAGMRRYQVRARGFQLVEVILAVAIIAVLASIAYPSYVAQRDRANNAAAMTDVAIIAEAIERFYISKQRFPDSLAELGMNGVRDPWDHPYRYLRILGAGIKGKGSLRKDKSLVPVNSDYDLYSMGKDGASLPPFTAKESHDDIVRANNGRYIGLAADY
jgi:general secretion pathway protein G